MDIISSFAERLSPVLSASRYLQRELKARSWLPQLLADTYHIALSKTEMLGFLAREAPDETMLKCGLRRLRSWVICHTAVRDLLGIAQLSEVVLAMTSLAEVALIYARDMLHDKLVKFHGVPTGLDGQPLEMIVVGMGKLGGSELNVSSDIDLIFLYPEDGETTGVRPCANFDFFTRLGRMLIAAMSEVTKDGFVFRVDMRLRPHGDSGSLVSSFDALENYFIAQGREWERFAWVKARPLCGSRVKELDALVRPFVFRKYLDFGAINALRNLHAQIRAQVVRREMAANIKLGPGGIREIEFIAQLFQIIRGGREAGLQIRPTLLVLEVLAERGLIDRDTAEGLEKAYVFLRKLEHRLQYLDDAQTHDLPASPEDRLRIAGAMHFSDEASMVMELGRHRAFVNATFQTACGDPHDVEHLLGDLWGGPCTSEQVLEQLKTLSFRNPDLAKDHLLQLRKGSCYRQLPEKIRALFDRLIPRVIEISAAQSNPDDALFRSLTLLERISRRGAYLALLYQYPHALSRMIEFVSMSSWASDYLTRHPILLDELLDGRHLEEITDWPSFACRLQHDLEAAEPDIERQMDLMREQHHAQIFRILHQDIAGKWEVEAIGDQLSALADVILDASIRQCWNKCKNRHCQVPIFAVIGYGKLGGKELGYASDLDIVFLYNDEHQEAPENYARLAQRMLTWLSTRTTAGSLFDIDTRLRPNGNSGLLVSHLDTFIRYQNESARLWEHQALTRARFVAGDARVGKVFESARAAILRQPRQQALLAEEVMAMRRKLLDSHGSRDLTFNVKDDVGGLIDFEFIIQYLVLGWAHAYPQLVANFGNIALSRIAGELGLIDVTRAKAAADGYRTLRRMQHRLRLNREKALLPEGEAADARQAIIELWLEVFGRAA